MKRLNPFAIAVLIVAILPVSCVKPTGDQKLSAQRDPTGRPISQEALDSAKETRTPDISPATYMAAAGLFESQNQVASAAAQYQKALEADPNCAEAHNRLGILLGRVEQHAEAERHLRAAVELKPRSASLRNNLGYEYALQERWPEAEAELRNAIRLAPDFKRSHVNLGMVLCKQERFLEGLEAFEEAVPQADAYYNYGLMLRAAGKYRDAADAFKQALEIEPRLAAAKTQLDQIAGKVQKEEVEVRTAEVTPPTVAVPVKTTEAAQANTVAVQPETPVARAEPADDATEKEDPQELRNEETEEAAEEATAQDTETEEAESVADGTVEAPEPVTEPESDHAVVVDPTDEAVEEAAQEESEPEAKVAGEVEPAAEESDREAALLAEPEQATADDTPAAQVAVGFEDLFEKETAEAVPQFLGGDAMMLPLADDGVGSGGFDPFELPGQAGEPLPAAPTEGTPEPAGPDEAILPPSSDDTKPLDEASDSPAGFNPNWLMARPGATSLHSEPFDQVEEFRPVIWEFHEPDAP